jgi:hypothetical protein
VNGNALLWRPAPPARRRGPFSAFLTRRVVPLLVGGIPVVLGTAGCLCGGGGHFRDNRFEDAHVAYDVGAPGEPWRRVEVETANVAWYNDAHGASLLVNSHCEGVGDAPLAGLTSELTMGMTDRVLEEPRLLPFAGREAMETVATGKLDGVPRKLMLFVLKKDGCVYDVVYDASPAHFEAGIAAYRRVRDGLVIGPRRDHR